MWVIDQGSGFLAGTGGGYGNGGANKTPPTAFI